MSSIWSSFALAVASTAATIAAGPAPSTFTAKMTTRFLNLFSAPFIAVLAFPLASFAFLTTSLAFGTLLLRVSVVYVELAFALLQSTIAPLTPRKAPAQYDSVSPRSPTDVEGAFVQPHHARRRTSSSGSSSAPTSAVTNGQQTPLHGNNPFQANQTNGGHRNGATSGSATPGGGLLRRDASMASLLAGATTPRDYESVGGWRLTSDDAEDEALWMGINSRLELPALTIPSPRETMRYYHNPSNGASSLHASISAGLERLHASGGSGGYYAPGGHRRSLTGTAAVYGTTPSQQQRHQQQQQNAHHSQHHPSANGGRRGSAGWTFSAGSPELKPRSPAAKHRRGKSSGASSPEGYFGSAATAAGLGMTSSTGHGGSGGATKSADVSRRNSRRSSVSLVKVRGE